MVITGWEFHPDDAHLSTIQRSDVSADQPTWSGKMVTSGNVKVMGTVDGRPADATAHVGVTNRAPLLARFDPPQAADDPDMSERSEEHTSELQSPCNLVCRLLLEKKKQQHEMNRVSNTRDARL